MNEVEGASCAHLKVRWVTTANSDGTTSGWWACQMCNHKFFPIDPREEGCLCQACGRRYKIDLMIPDELWERVRPKDKEGAGGLLCGQCIMSLIESLNDFGAWQLAPVVVPIVKRSGHNQARLRYEIGERVQIIPLERTGRVMTIWFTKHGVQYEVRYFDNAKTESVYFYEDELRSATDKK